MHGIGRLLRQWSAKQEKQEDCCQEGSARTWSGDVDTRKKHSVSVYLKKPVTPNPATSVAESICGELLFWMKNWTNTKVVEEERLKLARYKSTLSVGSLNKTSSAHQLVTRTFKLSEILICVMVISLGIDTAVLTSLGLAGELISEAI